MNGFDSSRADDWPQRNLPLEPELRLTSPPEPSDAQWSAMLDRIAEAVLPAPTITPRTSSATRSLPRWTRPLLASAALVLVGLSASLIDIRPAARRNPGVSQAPPATSEPASELLASFSGLPIVSPDEVNVWAIRGNPGKGLVVGELPLPDRLVLAEAGDVELVSGGENIFLDKPDNRPMIFAAQR